MRAILRPAALSIALLATGFTAGWLSRPDEPAGSSQESPARLQGRSRTSAKNAAHAAIAPQNSAAANLSGLLQSDQEVIESGRGAGTNEKLLALFKEVLASQPESVRRARMEGIFSAMTSEDTRAIRKHLATLYVAGGQDTVAEYEIFMYHWARLEGMDVFRQLDEEKHGWEQGRFLLARNLAQLHPERAAEFASKAEGRDYNPAIIQGIASGLLRSDPSAALAFMAKHPPKDGNPSYGTKVMGEMIQLSGVEKAGQWLNLAADLSKTQPDQNLEWLVISGENAFGKVTHYLDPKEWRATLERQPDGGVWPAVSTYAGAAMTMMSKETPQAAAAWCINSVPESKRSDPKLWSGLMNTWVERSPDDAGRWLQTQQNAPHYDAAAYSFSRAVRTIDPEAAARWAETIKDPALRARAGGQPAVPRQGQ